MLPEPPSRWQTRRGARGAAHRRGVGRAGSGPRACAPGDHCDRRGRPAWLPRAPGDRNNRRTVRRRIPWRSTAPGWISHGRSAHPVHTRRAACAQG